MLALMVSQSNIVGNLLVLQSVDFLLVYRDLIYQEILSVSQCSYYCYVMFCEVANHTCRNSLCNILMIISEYYGFNMERKHGMIHAKHFI